MSLEELRGTPEFDEKGLLPAVVQDVATRQVLMVAYMNEEAYRLTRQTGHAWFYSRSRQELWHKGETSGSFLHVRRLLIDCDEDTVLLLVEPEGPACHTGNVSCFYREVNAAGELLELAPNGA